MERIHKISILKRIFYAFFILSVLNVLAISISPFYAASKIRLSLLWGDISLLSVHWHGDKLYYALRDVTGNFSECSDDYAYVANFCSKDNEKVPLDLISLYSQVNEERNKLIILGLLACIGKMDFVNSQESFLTNVLQDSIVPSTMTYKEKELRWNSLSLEEKEHTPWDDNRQKKKNAEAGIWALRYIGNPKHLDIIKDTMWHYHSDNSIVYYAIDAIGKIGIMQGANILSNFVDEFNNDKETTRHCEITIEKLSTANEPI